MVQKQQFIERVRTEAQALGQPGEQDFDRGLQKLQRTLRSEQQREGDWEAFRTRFEGTHPGFLQRLKQCYPKLSATDFRLSSLVLLNFSSREIAALLHIGHGSVNTARYRLRKKLGLTGEQDLREALLRVSQTEDKIPDPEKIGTGENPAPLAG